MKSSIGFYIVIDLVLGFKVRKEYSRCSARLIPWADSTFMASLGPLAAKG
jgi:hypothetical protein